MKLARKLTLALVLVVMAVLALNAAERISRDRELLRHDTRRDHHSLGHALSVLVLESLREDGEQRALSLISAANERESAVQVRWVWLPGEAAVRGLDAHALSTLAQQRDVDRVIAHAGEPWLYSYFPVRIGPGRRGAIEISESLHSEAEAVDATVVRTLVSSISIALLAGVITSALGVWMVGRPVEALMDKARRVGTGDLSGPIELSQRDELSDLAREMNAMCDRLASALASRQHALEQLRHAERLATVGRLAAGVAHELGTPLNVVGIEAKRIATGRAKGKDVEEGAQVIATQAERMAAIIRQLLDFARRRPPRLEPLELGALARETLALVSVLAARHRVTLQHEASAPAAVHADPAQLQQVITNLVVNAVQSMPEGGIVRVETGGSGDAHAFLRVVDRGTGIDDDALPRIFEPFYTTKEVGQGTGLGLAVAHGIIEEHGGHIDVTSTLGVGSTFTVHLPCAREETV
ncbi:MAG: ATP-binding protein [Polyangiales bacterium]